jgi:hypothetical protein
VVQYVGQPVLHGMQYANHFGDPAFQHTGFPFRQIIKRLFIIIQTVKRNKFLDNEISLLNLRTRVKI